MIPSPSIYTDWKTWAEALFRYFKLESSRPAQAPRYVVATLPRPVTPGLVVFVENEAGGAVLAFSDGTNWRRVTDRAIVS